MSELIDRERFSADMRDFQNRVGIWSDEAEDTETRTRADAALATIIETKLILDKQPTIPAPRWHRVEDGLPRGQEPVIVAVKDTAGDTPFWYTQCGWITTDGEYWIIDNEICDYVVAWMPLPEPPKEEE